MKAAFDSLSENKRRTITRLLEDRRDLYAMRFADVVTEEYQVTLEAREFGIKLDVGSVIAFGRLSGSGGTVDGFNPIKTTPSLGSNVYLTYDGRSRLKGVLNFLPGAQLSLLGLGNGEDAAFTLGLVHPIFTKLRPHFGLFFGWHDLRRRVWGVTFSPDINFRTLLSADKPK